MLYSTLLSYLHYLTFFSFPGTHLIVISPDSLNQAAPMASSSQQSNVTADQNSQSTTPESTVPPYTTEEKQWLKMNHRDEFHFLRTYGFSIYNEEQRAEGRLIVRAFMDDEKEDSQGGTY